ncbi:MAG: response regulator [Rhodothermia bacterium]|nr:response regulator [Rhodothermia bacterium]
MQQEREPIAGATAAPDRRSRVDELQARVADLERMLSDSEKLGTMKSTVLTNLSHEIRTPLAAIVGFASILEEELSERHGKFLGFIERSGKRLMDALNSILNLSMLEEGSYKLHLDEVNIVQQIEEEIGGLKRAAEEKGIELKVHYEAQDLVATVDRTAIDRIVHNLLENAIRFTDNGSIELEVTTAGSALEIRVSDTGIGIRPSFQEVMFDAFSQEADVARSYDGVGLGLTITKRLVDLMNGQVAVQSEPGRGSTFLVTIPGVIDNSAADTFAQVVQADRRTNSSAVTTSDEQSEPEEKPRVLAVEDNPDMLILLQHLLSSRCEVSTASDGTTALNLSRENQFDAVLMDINLGEDETGVDVMLNIRKLSGYETTPFIAVTAYALPGDRERFLQAGFDGYIGKPFTKQQLFRMMDHVLSKAA